MLLGPLFLVEMVTVARRRRYFVLRVVYGALALFILWATYASVQNFATGGSNTVSIQQGATLATRFFVSFSWLQILTVLAVGPALAVGTIATERERRTIEYLLTTDLSNAEIVLGKLVARLCLFGQLLLVGLPILFLFRLLGGIPAQLLMVTFLFAASTSLLIAALSICVSVWSERARDAIVRVYLLLTAMIFLPLIIHSFTFVGRGPFNGVIWTNLCQPVLDFCMDINPIWILATAMGSQSALGAGLDTSFVWHTVSRQFLVSIIAILWATFAVRRVHLKESTKAAARRRLWSLPKWRRPLGCDAILWKEVFAGTATTRLGILGKVSIGLILITICSFTVYALNETLAGNFSNQRGRFHEYLMVLTYLLGTGVLLMLAARASGLVTSEKERDCWLSLLSTPLSGREIIRGKLWGNLYSSRWSLVVLAVHWGVGVLLEPGFLLAALATLATFLLYAWYVTNLGLFFSLSSQTTLRAMGATLGTLLFTGGGYMFCCCMVAQGTGSSESDLALFLAPCIPFQIAFPTLAYLETARSYSMMDENMPIAYTLGTIGYLVVGAVLYWYMTAKFNRLAGRTEELPEKLSV